MKQHREDTKHVQWQDGMFIMLSDLHCDYEKALVESIPPTYKMKKGKLKVVKKRKS